MIIPTERTVVIKPHKVQEGKIIDRISEKKQETGKVVAIGASGHFDNATPRPFFNPKIKIGDIIAYRRFGDDRLFLKGKEYLFVKFEDILGIIKD